MLCDFKGSSFIVVGYLLLIQGIAQGVLAGIHQDIAQAQPIPTSNPLLNQAEYRYEDEGSGLAIEDTTNLLELTPRPRQPPVSQVLSCGGELLSDYSDFSAALYQPNPTDPTGTELGSLVALPSLEPVLGSGNGDTNQSNPVELSTSGTYSFWLSAAANAASTGGSATGNHYILVINPPSESNYRQRRIKITVSAQSNAPGSNRYSVSYTAIALDGQPLNRTGETQTTVSDIPALAPAILFPLQLETVLCKPDQISIAKTADRASAEPGDTVIYRLAIRNRSDISLSTLTLFDQLPRGMTLLDETVQAELVGQPVVLTTQESRGGNLIIGIEGTIAPDDVLTLVYAARVTPDAVRGSGKNRASISGKRIDNGLRVTDGPSVHKLRIRPGILSDSGLLMGRVFDDKNFDGEQQRGEPGLPNAVIYLQDGNRIITDENGLFSVTNVLPGHHTGVLDLASIPGYHPIKNPNRREFNTGSRLVRLAPGGMARLNFPVTPLTQEGR